MQKYGKSIVSFLYGIFVVVMPLVSDDKHIGSSDGVAILVAALQLALVWLVPLAPQAPWVKTVVGAALAGAQVLAAQLLGGIDGNDVALIVASIMSALGIWLAPAESPKAVTAVGWGSDSPTRVARIA